MEIVPYLLGFTIVVLGVFCTMFALKPFMLYALEQKWGDRRVLFVLQLFLISLAFVGISHVFDIFVPDAPHLHFYFSILVGPIIGNMSVVSL
jgi:hypothetical protein